MTSITELSYFFLTVQVYQSLVFRIFDSFEIVQLFYRTCLYTGIIFDIYLMFKLEL